MLLFKWLWPPNRGENKEYHSEAHDKSILMRIKAPSTEHVSDEIKKFTNNNQSQKALISQQSA